MQHSIKFKLFVPIVKIRVIYLTMYILKINQHQFSNLKYFNFSYHQLLPCIYSPSYCQLTFNICQIHNVSNYTQAGGGHCDPLNSNRPKQKSNKTFTNTIIKQLSTNTDTKTAVIIHPYSENQPNLKPPYSSI